MSGSRAGEMAPTSSKAVVFPKFDMHVYTSELTSSELETEVADYLIPMDFHPRLPPPGMTMDKLSSWYIGLYVEQLEQGGLRVLFSSFFLAVIKHFRVHVSQLVPMGVNRVILFEIRCLSLDVRPIVSLFWVFYKLCKQDHWFSFENKIGRGTRKYFKEVTTSLKGWKRKILLIDRRAIPDAMPWRHGDTDLNDDFSSNFNQDDVELVSEFLVPLQPPPLHLLYVCGLTTAYRHPGLSYSIKDQDKNVISMDTFLKLPTWASTIVSKGDPIPEDQRLKSQVTPSLPKGSKILNLTAFQRSVEMPNTKIAAAREKKERQSLTRAKAKRAGVRHAGGRNRRPATVIPPEIAQEAPHVKKEVVDLSGNTRVSTPLATAKQPSPPLGHHDADENPDPDSHELVGNRYAPNRELWNDLRVWTYRACRELVDHVATHAEDEFLGTLSNVEVLSRAYQTLGQSVVAQGELLKRHEQLNHDYNMVKELERERDEWRATASDQEFIPTVVKRLHTSVKYRKSLAAPVQLCFTAGWLGGLALGRTEEKIADSCDLPLSELWSLHLDDPSPEGVTLGGAAESTIQRPPSTSLKTTFDIPFETTT
uniref:Transposase (putative) gypsy type domain-containing protein n=1 Tax=Tanacetum cinerariifolium TaxID=118510 RepID=A0A6L2JHJ2_TANCI|nr:hypothetical protein [Tanacetum cinerariifolium]